MKEKNIEITFVAEEGPVPPKKTKLVWGIVLAAIGLLGMAGAGKGGCGNAEN